MTLIGFKHRINISNTEKLIPEIVFVLSQESSQSYELQLVREKSSYANSINKCVIKTVILFCMKYLDYVSMYYMHIRNYSEKF